MARKTGGPGNLEELKRRELALYGEFARINQETHNLEERRIRLQKEKKRLREAISALESIPDALDPDTVPTLKNSQFLRAWGAIQRELRHAKNIRLKKEGVSQRALLWEARKENPNLNPSTFRTYLHRLKNEGRIKKLPEFNTWVLVPRTEQRTEEDDK